MKFAICQEIFGDVPFEHACARAKAHGYQGIELTPYIFGKDIRKLDERYWADIRETAAQHGLQLVAFHWLLASPEGLSITSPRPEIRAETFDLFHQLIRVASILQVPVLVFGSPNQRNIDGSWDPGKARDRGIQFFSLVAEQAAKNDIMIAFEPLGPEVTNFGATFDEALEIIKQVL